MPDDRYAGAKPGGVMTLDLSGIVGWAYGQVWDENPIFGCWHLPKLGGEGARYAQFENELCIALEVLAPRHLVIEAPLPLQAQNDMKVCEQQFALRGMCLSEGWRSSVAVSEVSAEIVRQEVLGQSRFRKGTVKIEVLAYCKSRGWIVPDHNAGDACCIWEWHVRRIRGERPAPDHYFANERPEPNPLACHFCRLYTV